MNIWRIFLYKDHLTVSKFEAEKKDKVYAITIKEAGERFRIKHLKFSDIEKTHGGSLWTIDESRLTEFSLKLLDHALSCKSKMRDDLSKECALLLQRIRKIQDEKKIC
jgi:hypothetical protein